MQKRNVHCAVLPPRVVGAEAERGEESGGCDNVMSSPEGAPGGPTLPEWQQREKLPPLGACDARVWFAPRCATATTAFVCSVICCADCRLLSPLNDRESAVGNGGQWKASRILHRPGQTPRGRPELTASQDARAQASPTAAPTSLTLHYRLSFLPALQSAPAPSPWFPSFSSCGIRNGCTYLCTGGVSLQEVSGTGNVAVPHPAQACAAVHARSRLPLGSMSLSGCLCQSCRGHAAGENHVFTQGHPSRLFDRVLPRLAPGILLLLVE